MKTFIILTVNKRYKYFKEEAPDAKIAMRQLMRRKPKENLIGCKELQLSTTDKAKPSDEFVFNGKYKIIPHTFVPFDVFYHNGEEEE